MSNSIVCKKNYCVHKIAGMDEFSSYSNARDSNDDISENANDVSNGSAESWSYEDDHISVDGNDDVVDSWPSYATDPPEENQLVGTNQDNEEEQVPYSSYSIFPPEDDHVVGDEADNNNVSRVYFDFSLLQVTTLKLTVLLFLNYVGKFVVCK